MNDFREGIKVDLKEKRLTEREARQTYEKFVLDQQEQFVLCINYLNQYVNELRKQGFISPFLQFYARIKATNSALKNYEKKALDDIFGIEFICATEKEIEILQQALEPILKAHKVKQHNKSNGYKATHVASSIKEDARKKIMSRTNQEEIDENKFPVMEVQYKTIDVYYEAVYGTASHEKYKDTKIPQLQALYDNDSLTVGEYIPYMWISDNSSNNMREMTTEEVLKKMYPSLKLKEGKEEIVTEDKNNSKADLEK